MFAEISGFLFLLIIAVLTLASSKYGYEIFSKLDTDAKASFAIYGVLPVVIGWFGVVASVLYVLGNALIHLKPNVKALWNVGGLLIWILESVLGGGLLCFSLIL